MENPPNQSNTLDAELAPTIVLSDQKDEDNQQRDDKFHLLTQNMMEGFAYCKIIFDQEAKPVDFICLEVNNAFEELTGIKRSDIVGKKATQIMAAVIKSHPEIQEALGRLYSTGQSESFKIQFKPLGICLSARAFCLEKNHIGVVFEDITEQKQLSEKFEEYSEGLEKTIQQKTEELQETQTRLVQTERLAAIGELAGMIGHDLRNPLSGIRNAVYFLRKKQACFIGDSGDEMLTVIDRAVEQANKVINDLLDYSKELHLELEEQSPKSIIDYVLLSINKPQNIKIIENIQSQPEIWVDTNKIERVFINLVDNAIEAMPNGGTIEIKSQTEPNNIIFTFTDTGCGMSDNTLAKIFTPLFTTKAKGMGFGLAICKRIIEAHGGKITVTSALKKGTSFTITLPIEHEKIEPPSTES